MIELNKEKILTFIFRNKGLLKERFGVLSIGLIGSYARDEQTENSDIDFLVEFSEPNFHYLAGLVIFLEKEFEKKVDVIGKKELERKSVKLTVSRDVIYA